MTEPILPAAVQEFLASVRKGAARDDIFPVSAELHAKEEAHRKALAENPCLDAQPGDLVPELGGVFVGPYMPVDSEGKKLGQIFNVIAAREDLPLPGRCSDYAKTVDYIRSRDNLDGYHGEAFETDTELVAALKGGSYNGGWVIPPRELLDGCNANGIRKKNNSLYTLRNTGGLTDTFSTKSSIFSGGATNLYTSCSEMPGDPGYSVVNFSTGEKSWHTHNLAPFNVRLVRLIPVKP